MYRNSFLKFTTNAYSKLMKYSFSFFELCVCYLFACVCPNVCIYAGAYAYGGRVN